MKGKTVLSVGACLNDVLLHESEAFLAALGREKGGMTMVERAEQDRALARSTRAPESAPGGSACNTAVGLARLGARSMFLGRRGDDEAGRGLERQLSRWGVECRLKVGPEPTGSVLSVITPDAQRTMLTHLGAAAGFTPADLAPEDFAGRGLVHLEGYLLFSRDLALRAVALAKAAGAQVSLDLASFEVVRASRDILPRLLAESVDIVIANEDESKEYTGHGPEKSLEVFAGLCATAVVKLGASGVLVARGKERIRIPALRVDALDTTGAGDLWASGFLYGLLQGWPLERAAGLGNRMGSTVVQVVGAQIPEPVYADIRREWGIV